MLELTKIDKCYGDKRVLEDINLCLNEEVVALIGENGAGKTTLLKIMLGEIQADNGQVLSKHAICGYMQQSPICVDTIRDGFRLGIETWRMEAALQRVGLNQPLVFKVDDLSGGQKTRLAIAYVLAQSPELNVLLLDEPTNNLDLEALRWLEKFVKQFRGSIIIASHNRSFVNRTCTKVLELKNSRLTMYRGNYDSYRSQKESELQAEIDVYEANIKERRRVGRMISTIRQRMQQVDGEQYDKIKHQSKMSFKSSKNPSQNRAGQDLRALTSRLGQMEKIENPNIARRYSMNLEGHARSRKLILKLENITMRYQEILFEQLELNITGCERVRVSGRNGSGKSTLLKIVMGLESPTAGTMRFGHNIITGYLSQEIDGLNHQKTALANLEDITSDKTAIYREVRALGFKPEDLREKPDALSRGQQTKLSFCKLLLAEHNLLVLDELTNHLDIPSREAIERALQDYQGAMLIVSHDDYFVQSIGVTQELNLDEGVHSKTIQ